MIPTPEVQIEFIVKVQRLLAESRFAATYKFALLVAIADLVVERGQEAEGGAMEPLALDCRDIAERFIAMYWRQVVPWVAGSTTGTLAQATGAAATILQEVARAHEAFGGSMSALRRDRKRWSQLVGGIAKKIAEMPLWRLQRVGNQSLEFLYPQRGRGGWITLYSDAVYCLWKFRDLVVDLAQAAWLRFVRNLPANQALLGPSTDLEAFLFGSARTSVAGLQPALRAAQDDRCFYCAERLRSAVAIDHFVPWSRYPLDDPFNLVATHATCNTAKSDRLASVAHLERWCARTEEPAIMALAASHPDWRADVDLRIAWWAYDLAERSGGQLWSQQETLVPVAPHWRSLPRLVSVHAPQQSRASTHSSNHK